MSDSIQRLTRSRILLRITIYDTNYIMKFSRYKFIILDSYDISVSQTYQEQFLSSFIAFRRSYRVFFLTPGRYTLKRLRFNIKELIP